MSAAGDGFVMSNDVQTVGELLQAARKAQGLSVESIANDICVRSSYLVAIEADKHDELPEKTFAIGFVRSYATALGLDAGAVVARFKEEIGASAPMETMVSDVVLAAPRRRFPAWISPFAGVLGVALCWAVFGNSIVPLSFSDDADLIDRKTDVAQLQAVQASLPAMPQATTEDTAADAGNDTGQSAVNDEGTAEAVSYAPPRSLFSPAAIAGESVADTSGRSDFTLQAQEDAWVRLANADGTEIWSGVLREGQSYRPHFDGVALLSTSNAGGVSIRFGSSHLDALGARGEVVENIRLDGERLFSDVKTATGSTTGSR